MSSTYKVWIEELEPETVRATHLRMACTMYCSAHNIDSGYVVHAVPANRLGEPVAGSAVQSFTVSRTVEAIYTIYPYIAKPEREL